MFGANMFWPNPIQCGFAAIEFQQMPDGKG
jgi:hypothetical protein